MYENRDKSWTYGTKMPPVDIEFSNLTYTVSTGKNNTKTILKGVSGQFKSNELTAIMGPSGSGKSTLLNILTGYEIDGIGGVMSVNGQPIDMQYFKKMTCYIMQDDLLQPKLTVREAMNFSADLKLGSSISHNEKQTVITKILVTLRLSNAENTIMERLSGGEKKRLSIALELVNNPPVIFLDEPTTGLDELSSLQCIDLLQRVAQGGRTVICSIHTPSASIFSKFHHVYIVAAGQCVYRGSVNSLVPFLNHIGIECPRHYNPADFIIDVSGGEYGMNFVKKMISQVDEKFPILPIRRSSNHDIETIYRKKHKVSFYTQFRVLLKRMMLQLIRDRNYLFMKTFLAILMGFTIGGIYMDIGRDGSKSLTNLFYYHTTLFYFLCVPMFPIPLRFPPELQILKREHFNRWYDITPYFIASTISCLPVQIILGITKLIISYYLTQQLFEYHRIALFFTICIVFAFISETMGYIIGTIFKISNGVFAGALIISASHVTAIQGLGDTEPMSTLRIILMHSLPFRYALQGLFAAGYKFNRGNLDCPDDFCRYQTPVEIMKIARMENVDYRADFVVLIIYWIACRSLLYYLLRQRVHPNAMFRALRSNVKLIKNHINNVN